MPLAPIIVFAYNRPEHLRKTLTWLGQNELADQSALYIYCDGPKPNATDEQLTKVQAARKVAHEVALVPTFKEVHIIERKENLGLGTSVITGVTEIINKHGRAIVLEDDLLTSPYFLKYMNEALDFYESRPAVMSVSANRPPVGKMQIPADYEYDVFVSLRPFSTGWATWKDKWNRIDWSMDYLKDFLKHPEQIKAFNRGGDDLTNMLLMQRDHKIDSWAIRYAFQHFYHHAVAILPCLPYVDNIGFDGTGIHSGTNEHDFRNNVMLAPINPRLLDVVYEDSRIINAFYGYYSRAKRPLWKRVVNYIYQKLGKQQPFLVKKKVYCE